MSYNKTNWVDRLVEKPNTFNLVDNGDGTSTITESPGVVYAEGTPIDAAKLNNIESGITGAYRRIEDTTYFNTPLMFGAKGDYNPINDTGTNDSQAFIDCINSSEGVVIDLMGKTYVIGTRVEIDSKKIELANGKLINKTGELMFLFKSCKVKLSNVEVDSKGTSQRCIRLENCIAPIIKSCNIYNVVGSNPDLLRFVSCPNILVSETKINGVYGSSTGAGITLQDSESYILKCHNFLIEKNFISEIYPAADGDGIKTQSAFSSGIIDKNTFENCAKRAIKCQINFNNEVYKSVIITNNTVIGGGDYAAIDTQCGNSLIHYNEIIDCLSTAISLQEGNNDVRFNKIRSATTLTTTSGSAITVASLGYLNTNAKTNRIEYNQIRGTAPYALALRSTMEYQDLFTFKSNDIDLPLSRYSILISSNNVVRELDISFNKFLSIPTNYIRMISRTGSCTVNRLEMVNNSYNTTVANQLNRDVIESLTPNAYYVHVTFSSDVDVIEVRGQRGNLTYNYKSTVNPANTTTANQLNRASLSNSKIFDYAEKTNKTFNSEGILEKGWICKVGSSTDNPRGVWELVLY